jgi:RNA polymerase sigma factor (sigma-70 family)
VDDEKDNSPLPVAYAEDANVVVNKRKAVRKVIRTAPELSENERQIGIMYYNMRLKYKEIAETLELPMGTVKGLLNRLKNKLEPKLAHLGATAM